MNRKGQYWSTEEHHQLIREMEERLSLETIAKNHGRSVRAIELRFLSFVKTELAANNNNMNEIAQRFHLDPKELQKRLQTTTDTNNNNDDQKSTHSLCLEILKRVERIEHVMDILFRKKKK